MLTLIMGTDWTANRAEILRLLALDVADKRADAFSWFLN